MENNENQVTEQVNDQVTEQVGTQANENKDEVKTFSQDEVNAMLKKEKDKVAKKYEGIDVAKYREWEESQKTAEQRQAEKETEYQNAIIKIKALEQEKEVLTAGVKGEDIDYVLFKVGKMDGEFSENLAKFLEENPKYMGQKLNDEPKATGAPVRTVSSSQNDGVLGILASKHPNINF